jgi:molybdenum cofactor synthesis domain-containing protein
VISVNAALAAIEQAIEPLPPETIALADAPGRTLAADVAADIDFPPFDTTAMDGYAVRGAVSEARERPGTTGAGGALPAPLSEGEAARVMTGAPIPAGAEAVVPVEDVEQQGDALRFRTAPLPGAHVRRRGEIFRAGARVLCAGDRLSPERILVCATVGAVRVAVTRLPRVALAATGDEIVDPASRPAAAQIRNGNGPAIAAALARRGIHAATRAAVPDRLDALKRFFGEESDGFDLLLTTGGVSVGDYDHAVEAAASAGFEVVFHGVAVKPGKPVAFARRARAFWFGLPGNPVSALTTFHLFVDAALDRFEGVRRDRFVEARLVGGIRSKPGRETYRDARLFVDGGQLRVEAIVSHGSHDIVAQAARNALLVLPADGGAWNDGDRVRCLRCSGPAD